MYYNDYALKILMGRKIANLSYMYILAKKKSKLDQAYPRGKYFCYN